jgi:hypothetical protein
MDEQGTPAFLTALEVRKLGTRDWVLLAPLQYRSALVDDVITVPTGFITDFASVPRAPLAYWLTGNTGHHAAVVHDYLYRTGRYTRHTCDEIFSEALTACGEPPWRVRLMYQGVSMYGASAYRGQPDPGPEPPQPERVDA